MVNSIGGNTTSFSSSIVVGDGCGGNVVDRPAVTNKDRFTQPKNGHERSVSPSSADTTASVLRETGFAAARTTADGGVLPRFSIDEEHKDAMTATTTTPSTTTTTTASGTDLERARGVYCSLPLEKVQGVIGAYASQRKPVTKKLLCLYCDRSFVTTNLRQKHVDRCHSLKQVRRQSSRRNQSQPKLTPCAYCDKIDGSDLKLLFTHLATAHPKKYYACVPCEERFATLTLLNEHNAESHPLPEEKFTRSKQKQAVAKMFTINTTDIAASVTDSVSGAKTGGGGVKKTVSAGRELKNKKLAVKSTKIGVKRSARLQSKGADGGQKVTRKQKNAVRAEDSVVKTSTSINPYPQFDSFFQVKKITDHSIDNLRISTLTFEDVVFDKAFYNRIKCNIQENLLHHIDGKLFKNEESESRISNFEKVTTHHQEFLNNPAMLENYGCDISLNAATPVAMLLSTQFGEDLESQIEYGSKASKKKTQTRTEELPYKYFTRRKYQASILESKENRDLSKLDMWTQLIIKNRQQKIAHDKKSPKELLDYTKGQEYKNKLQQEELNRILDKRGPFEDLKEEASKKAAFDKLSSGDDPISQEHFAVVTDVLAEVVQRVCEKLAKEEEITATQEDNKFMLETNENMEIPSYLKLKRCSPTQTEEIDRSDRITLICSSQETENFDVPNATVRCKDEMVELTGEWARTRIYICAACGLKVSNMKLLIEHKSMYHQNVWCQHYEFVGNQSELYRHLSIPGLGKVGQVESEVKCKLWNRSDARVCSKCTKQCHTLSELHRHVLECGGDWSWMLARKKCKYRPFGAKTRRKRRGLVKRIINSQQKPKEKKRYKKRFEGPRQKPSDADTIQRMLANLPPKRATRKIMSLKDGFQKPAKKQVKVKNKVKCGKVICKQTVQAKAKEKKEEKENVRRKSLRRISKVLSSRILDTSKTLVVRRKIKSAINSVSQKNHIPEVNKSKKSPKRQEKQAAATDIPPVEQNTEKPKTDSNKSKKKSSVAKNGQVNIKNFFPVTKNPNKMKHNSENNEVVKKSKLDSVGNFVRTLSLRKAKLKAQKPDEQKTKAKSSLKRKLQSTIQTVVKKVKSVGQKKQNDVPKEFFRGQDAVSENKEDDDKMPLLEKIPDTPEKCDVPADLPILTPVVLNFEESASKNCNNNVCQIVETKNDESEESNNEVVPCRIINDPPKIIPCTKQKSKLKKPNRGLNDCIAMLTNKLQQQVVVNEPFSKPIFSFPNVIVPSIVEKDDFDTTIEDEAYEVLDLSKKIPEKESEKASSEELIVIDDKSSPCEASSLLMSKVEVIENAVKTHLARKLQPRRVSSRKIGQKREKQSDVPKKMVQNPFEEFNGAKVFVEMQEKCDEKNIADCDFENGIGADAKLLESHVEDVDKDNSRENSLDNNGEVGEVKINEQCSKDNASEMGIHENEDKRNIEDKELPSFEIKPVKVSAEAKQETSINNINEPSAAGIRLTVQATIESEEEGMTLENKSILKISPTIASPSDSEDEVPLSELRRSLCKTKTDDGVLTAEEETVDSTKELEELRKDEDLTTKDISEADSSVANEELSISTAEDIVIIESSSEAELEQPVRTLRGRSVNTIEQKRAETSCDSLLNDLPKNQEGSITNEPVEDSETQEVVEMSRELRSTKKNATIEDDKPLEASSVRLLRSRTSSTKDSESETASVIRRTSTRQQKDKQKTEKENDTKLQLEIQKEETLQDSTNLIVENKKNNKRKVPERKNGITKHDNPFEYLNTWNSDAQSSEWLFKSALKAQEQNSMLVPTLLAKPDEPVKQQTKPKTKPNTKRKKKSASNDSNIENKEFFCDICSKSFMRNDSLTKHYRTLMHIAKLSEIEAKQAAESKLIEQSPKRDEINLCNMLQESEKYVENKITTDVPLISSSFALNTTNSNTLKLADIINDVLNKPVEDNSNKNSSNFSNILQTSETKLKRCKSLGERKSFESDNVKSSNVVDFTDNFGSSTLDNNIFAKTTSCADSLLEKQISLLENMIENRTTLNYIDDISVSSENNSTRNSPSEISSIGDSKEYSNSAAQTKKVNLEKDTNNFIKPVQYEEISEDSGNYANNFEEQKSRKTLNRDEELFLECCSLLKSGSEVSSYSKESSKIKSFHLKPSYEADWPEHKSFSVQCHMNESSHFMSDTSRIPTPLGDNFVDDGCSSNTVSFDLKNKAENEPQKGDIVMFEDISEDKSLQGQPMMAEKSTFSFSFQFTEADEPSKGQEADIEDLADKEDSVITDKVSVKLSGMVDSIKNKFNSLKRRGKRRKKKLTMPSISDTGSGSSDEETDPHAESIKVATKGALKVFEGLKVSIPTEDIDLTQVLNKKPAAEDEKVQEPVEEKTPLPPNPIKPPKKNGLQKNLKSQTKPANKTETLKEGNKSYDVYDFEETQDNSDVFFVNPLSNYRTFRSQIETHDKPATPAKETETSTCTDTLSYEAVSVSSNSTISNVSEKKQRVDKNITKKKCMIMGRIFKNALKSKVDDDIREIPEVANEKLVNDYVLSCPLPETPKVTMTQEEMDRLFNNLLEGKTTGGKQDNNDTEAKNAKIDPNKTISNKQKPQVQKSVKPKKRHRNNSESTDDEFSIGKPAKKRTYKKSDRKTDSSINLEQELKECIGVASRKSQRKCTSGKQNVLVEFWSSDESVSEAILEVKPISEEKPAKLEEPTKEVVQEETLTVVPSLVEKIPEKEEEQQQTIMPEPPAVSKTQKKQKKPPSKPKPKPKTKELEKLKVTEPIAETLAANRRKRASVNTLYYWSSSSEDEFQDLIEVKSIRDEFHDDEDRPMQHGWIVGDSPKKLVTMLAQAKGKKTDLDSVKEQAKNRTSVMCS